uniref:N-acetyltransferase domain-containing protein n=1 Tax=Glycine max TaxID=3847 RepID=A0A0R0L094_SOYBN|eukprot:XP_003519260.2 probable N-acetyltransferase HLS1 [Glycine max]
MVLKEFKIRSYECQFDRAQVEDLERRCKVGPSESVLDTMGDPMCRIRNCPMYIMLVAEMDNELVGVIQGSIKTVTLHNHHPNKDMAKVGYVLGLRVSPHNRKKGIGSSLVQKLEEWFTSNDVDYAYMATEKENHASINLFMNKFGYIKFRTPSILINPVNHHPFGISSNIEIARIKVEKAESLYRGFMGASTEFFPSDIENILTNNLSLGTWVAYFKGDSGFGNLEGKVPNSWAMLSVWNCGEIFKLRLGKTPLSCMLFTKSLSLMNRIFPCLKLPTLPNFFSPFGFYFIYGVYQEGPFSGKLVRALCKFVHNMASKTEHCKIIVTEVGETDHELIHHVPHWKLFSCPDLWCIKALKKNGRTNRFHELTNTPPRGLFVDPREV